MADMVTTATNTELVPGWELRHRLARALEVSGVTVEEMADFIDRSERSVRYYMAGTVPVGGGVIRLWALRTGVSYEWLAFGGEPMGPRPAPAQRQKRGRARRSCYAPFTLLSADVSSEQAA